MFVWGWGGKDDNRAVRGVAVLPGGVALEHGGVTVVNVDVALEHGSVPGTNEAVAVVHGEEEKYQSSVEKMRNVTGKEADFVMDDFFTQIYFSSLVWRLAREEPEMFQEEMERRWKVLCEDLIETRAFKEDCDQVANQRPLKQLFLDKEEFLENTLPLVPRMKSMNYNPNKSMLCTLDSILEEDEMDNDVDPDYLTNNNISDYNANLLVRELREISRTSFNLPSILEECDY